MSQAKNNLHLFELDSNSIQDHVEMWHTLDSDYSEESDNWRVDDNLKELGFKSQAEKNITEVFENWNDDDLSRLQAILDAVESGHGDYSSQFESQIIETEEHVFYVAVSFLT